MFGAKSKTIYAAVILLVNTVSASLISRINADNNPISLPSEQVDGCEGSTVILIDFVTSVDGSYQYVTTVDLLYYGTHGNETVAIVDAVYDDSRFKDRLHFEAGGRIIIRDVNSSDSGTFRVRRLLHIPAPQESGYQYFNTITEVTLDVKGAPIIRGGQLHANITAAGSGDHVTLSCGKVDNLGQSAFDSVLWKDPYSRLRNSTRHTPDGIFYLDLPMTSESGNYLCYLTCQRETCCLPSDSASLKSEPVFLNMSKKLCDIPKHRKYQKQRQDIGESVSALITHHLQEWPQDDRWKELLKKANVLQAKMERLQIQLQAFQPKPCQTEEGTKGQSLCVGQKGDRGPKGFKGLMGFSGLKGPKGHSGLPGMDGVPGLPGKRGDPGLPGMRGERGFHGFPPGPKGEPGERGRPGRPGRPGVKGEPGPKGDQAFDGLPGLPGVKGHPGEDGLPGLKGEPGEPGQCCQDGLPERSGHKGQPDQQGQRAKEDLPSLPEQQNKPGLQGPPRVRPLNRRPGEPAKTRKRISQTLPQDDAPSGARPQNCQEIQSYDRTSGVHTLYVDDTSFDVYCEQLTNGGGWTAIQRRVNGSVPFNRTFEEYEFGFGHPSGDFWLGLAYIHQLTSKGRYSLRLDIADYDGSTAYAMYDDFSIEGRDSQYKIHVTGYSGTAGDGLDPPEQETGRINGMPFTTWDRAPPTGCTELYTGGWWYNHCFAASPNGKFRHTRTSTPYRISVPHDYDTGIVWYPWKRDWRYYKTIDMKIRPVE